MVHLHRGRDLSWRHRHREFSVRVFGQCHEVGVVADRVKHGSDARLHHFLFADRLVTLVLIKVTPEKLESLGLMTILGEDRGEIV